MNLFLDDIRNPPAAGWTLVRTAEDAIKILRTGIVTWISFDHDLGTELTGYDVAKEIEGLVYSEKIKCPRWLIHSRNPVGAKNIQHAMESAWSMSGKVRKINVGQ